MVCGIPLCIGCVVLFIFDVSPGYWKRHFGAVRNAGHEIKKGIMKNSNHIGGLRIVPSDNIRELESGRGRGRL